MHVDDLAEACIYFLNKKTKETLINVGTGTEMTIKQYVSFLKKKIIIKVKFCLIEQNQMAHLGKL